jgi:phosphatidylglycerophosphate synthase
MTGFGQRIILTECRHRVDLSHKKSKLKKLISYGRMLVQHSKYLLLPPLFLTLLRVALAPLLVYLAHYAPRPEWFAACLVTALLSDIFDGVIARKLGVATPALRRLDSIADSIFYVAAIYAVWVLKPEVILGHAVSLTLLLMLEVARYAFDFWKFKREASYHMWSSKLWGLALFAAFFSVLVLGYADYWVSAAIWLGFLADSEGLLISIVLPRWKNDVPSVFHALRIRNEHV